jgi:pseudouridine-5'-phosphate glycosidase
LPADPHIVLSPEVEAALKAGRPVVALESTIITHGMPFPQNETMANRVEAIVRAEGAVPATIAIAHGRLKVGLTAAELGELARIGGKAAKASRRDVAAILLAGGFAGTTVATTMQIAQLAGIRVFATGGIGGVHRGAESSFDISADLEELGRTPVAVVCAGAKSILDIAKTLEVLETKGVPVVGYGTDNFPAFWARSKRSQR